MIQVLGPWWLSGIALVAIVVILFAVNRFLEKRFAKSSQVSRVQNQLIMLALTSGGLLLLLLMLPLSDALRGQLLSLLGIVLSAALALSSTTFLGNAMAGVLLRVVKNFRVGDFVQINDFFGRVSERGLFHTEIQTVDRNLTTLPNLYLVTHPVTVTQSSGTIVSADVSLGYDVTRASVEESLIRAAESSRLKDPFVQVRELGDFSVKYEVRGLLEDVKHLITIRSLLRANMLDALHSAGIEIVSPQFMNFRTLGTDRVLTPPLSESDRARSVKVGHVEGLVFDKAEEAESQDRVVEAFEKAKLRVHELEDSLKDLAQGPDRTRIEAEINETKVRRDSLERRMEQLREQEKSEE